jgi:hypothetical protein
MFGLHVFDLVDAISRIPGARRGFPLDAGGIQLD